MKTQRQEVVEKIRENRLRWCGHVTQRYDLESVLIIVMQINVDRKRGIVRAKMRWFTVIKNGDRGCMR